MVSIRMDRALKTRLLEAGRSSGFPLTLTMLIERGAELVIAELQVACEHKHRAIANRSRS